MPSPYQKPPASIKVPDQYIKDRNALCRLKINLDGHNLEQESIKAQKSYPYHDQNVLSTFKINVERQNSNQELIKAQERIQSIP